MSRNHKRPPVLAEDICPTCMTHHVLVTEWGNVRCQGHSKQHDNRQCKAGVIAGLDKCKSHVGKKFEVARAEGREKIQQVKAAKAVERLIGPSEPVDDPVMELANIAGRLRARAVAAEQLVSALEQAAPDEDDEGNPLPPGFGLLVPTSSGIDIHPLVKFSERALTEARAAMAEMVKLGFTERRLRLDEQDSALLEAVLVDALTEAGVDVSRVLPLVGAKLRAIEASATEEEG